MALDKNKIIAEATKLVQKGAFDKAIKTYEKILAEDPKDVRVLLKVGELHQKKGDDRAAAEAFEKVAETYAEQGFFLKSVAVHKQIVKLAPDDVRVNERLAGLYQQLGLMSDAMGQLQLMASAYERQGDAAKLSDVLRRMVELDPDNIASSIKLGELQARAGQHGPALDCFKRAAEYLKKHNRADEYLKVAERIAVLKPDDRALTRELAHSYLAKGDTKRALAKLQLCFKTDPKDVETLQLLAQTFRELGQTSKTLSVYKELAHVHEERGRREDARATWRRVLELSAGDEDALAALQGGHPLSTPVAAMSSPPPRAPAAGPPPGAGVRPAPSVIAPPPPPPSQRAAAAAPPSRAGGVDAIPKLLTETDVYVKYGLHDKALDHLRKVLAIDPQCPDAHEKVRELHLAAGRKADAAQAAVAAVRALLGRGLADRAREAISRLRVIAPGHPELGELNAGAGGSEEVLLATDEIAVEDPAASDDDALAHAAASAEDEEVVDDEPIAAPDDEAEVEIEAPDRDLDAAGDALAEAAAAASAESDEIVDEPPPAPPPARAAAKASRVAPPPAARAPSAGRGAHPDLSDELEEADFFVQQGLFDDAREALENLRSAHPGHPVVAERLRELDERAARGARAAKALAPRPTAPLAVTGADESFDIASELAAELGDEPSAPADAEEFQYSVEDVFSQFKKGVEQTVRPEDSATHYDLGIAYKEMALVDDAIQEFETALKGNDKKREVDCLSMIGLCRMSKGEPQEAIRAYRRALASELLTKEAAKAIQYELGEAYEAANEAQVGLWFLQRVAKLDPSFREVAAKIQALGGGPGRPPAAPPAAAPARPGAPPPAPKKNIGYL
jgi:tetratricopeptide (TPR) repeat protein